MWQENVRVVQGMYAAFARDDIAAMLESADREIRCYDRPDRPGRGRLLAYRPVDG